MRFGVRECCDVVLRAKANQQIGNKIFYKNEPVIYFDTLKTSTLEGAATTVYATGGRGNARLIGWDGERTVTWTMEDALISPEGFMILSGAGLIEATDEDKIKVHATTRALITVSDGAITFDLEEEPYTDHVRDSQGNITGKGTDMSYIYVMLLDGDEVATEPYTPASVEQNADGTWKVTLDTANDDLNAEMLKAAWGLAELKTDSVVLVDYYVEKGSGSKQIDISADKFGGNYYLEASTLFRDTNGVDMPAEFIIPNCKVQSNFTFTMAGSGDPSTFSFTMDSFPDYTRFNPTEKVYASIQIVAADTGANELTRPRTKTTDKADSSGIIYRPAENAGE